MKRTTTKLLAPVVLLSSQVFAATVFDATLSGAQETPPNLSSALGFATGTLDTSTNIFSLTLFFSGLTSTETAAHIHMAPPGVAGPIVEPLGLGDLIDVPVMLSSTEVSELLAGNLYVNVHTTTFPDGEIRGQFAASFSGSAVPEPGSFVIVTAGLAALVFFRRRNMALRVFTPMLFALCAASAWAQTWQSNVEAVMGMPGTMEPGGVLRFHLVRENTTPVVDGVVTKPQLTTDGYAAFKMESGSQFLMTAELGLLENEVNPFITVISAGGLELDGVHNHFIHETPRLVFVHMTGIGDPVLMARVLKIAIAQTAFPSVNDDNVKDADDPVTGIDTSTIHAILHGTPEEVDGVYEVTVDRKESPSNHGLSMPPAMGPQTDIDLQPLGGGRAAVQLEFCLVASEVPAAIRILRANNIQITALHNHFLADSPHYFFLHAFAVGDAVSLAKIARQVLDQTNSE